MNFLLITFLLAQIRPPPARISCIATNSPQVLVHINPDKTAVEQEVDDWRVNCKITIGEQIIFNQALTTVHPESLLDAAVAIEDFRKKKAPLLLKHAKD